MNTLYIYYMSGGDYENCCYRLTEFKGQKLRSISPTRCNRNSFGGAKGIDTCAREYAQNNNIKLTEFLPDYDKYGRSAPIKRNVLIVDYADMVLAFWDGQSRGTKFVIDKCRECSKPVKIFVPKKDRFTPHKEG